MKYQLSGAFLVASNYTLHSWHLANKKLLPCHEPSVVIRHPLTLQICTFFVFRLYVKRVMAREPYHLLPD